MIPRFLALSGLMLFLGGCAKPDNPAEIRAAAKKPLTPQSRRLAFSLDDFVESYRKFGVHSEKWDSSATMAWHV
jgi:PBP1b-binding outer membrane lipoprotein LpoB